MGLDAYLHLTIGIRVKMSDMFDDAGVEYRCASGHKRAERDAYCATCGARVSPRSVRKPKPALAAYAKRRGLDPEDIWGETDKAVSVHCVDGTQSSEDDDGVTYALGEALAGDSRRSRSAHDPVCEALANLAAAESRILAAAKELEIPEPHVVEVFASACLSTEAPPLTA